MKHTTEPMTFSELALNTHILKALDKKGYKIPTPIQEQAIPVILAKKDLLAIAQTGTGKTAAFCLPILNNLVSEKVTTKSGEPRVLILTPTRELAVQIYENLIEYGDGLNQKYAVVFGGVSQGSQVRDLQRGPHVLVATPGRLHDLIEQKFIRLNQVDTFVLDEADRMLDMGFLNEIKKVIKMLPKKRHSLFFSATMPREIEALAREILVQPTKVEVTPESTTVERIQQSVMFVDKPRKSDLLLHLLENKNFKRTLVFVEMKHVANRISEALTKSGVSASAIHGNKSQSARQKALQDFKDGKVRVLVATDLASRGIDVDGITHVINYELSNITESYVHRVGRTARAGKDGMAVSLVTADEKSYLAEIEKVTNQKIPVDKDHPYHSDAAENAVVMGVGRAKAKIEAERKAGGRSGARSSQSRSGSRSQSGAKSNRPRSAGSGGANKSSEGGSGSSQKAGGQKKSYKAGSARPGSSSSGSNRSGSSGSGSSRAGSSAGATSSRSNSTRSTSTSTRSNSTRSNGSSSQRRSNPAKS
jgi:ATP-dependent RNA helicase RhlE